MKLYQVRTIGAEAAGTLVAHVTQAAMAKGLNVAVTVAGVDGAMVAALRMDGVAAPILEFATDKAFTAATMGKSSQAFGERMTSSPTLSLGLSTRTGLLPWGGAVPLVENGEIVGAIGVSGATDEDDIALAADAARSAGFETAP